MTDAADADPSMPDALEIAAALDREFAQDRQARRSAARRRAWRSKINTTRSTCARRPAPMRPTRTIVRPTTRRSSSDCATRARSFLRKPILASTPSAFRAARSAARSAIRTTPSAARAARARVPAPRSRANLVTCAIAEETGSSIRGPARAASAVGHRADARARQPRRHDAARASTRASARSAAPSKMPPACST